MAAVKTQGILQKLKTKVLASLQVEYYLPWLDHQGAEIPLNPLLGKTLSLSFDGVISCLACQRKIKKSFNQGYCFPCSQTKACCDICIVRPEKCHYHLGTCREPKWGETHCMIPHVIYLANTSGLKVGITRGTQIPTRWIDQGATEAIAIAQVSSRYEAGLVEIFLSQHLKDKTNWRQMLKGESEPVDLLQKGQEIQTVLQKALIENEFANKNASENVNERLKTITWLSLELKDIRKFHYPILQHPQKVVALNIDKTPQVTSRLLGIKGQYLILEAGVLNMRNLGGYEIVFLYS